MSNVITLYLGRRYENVELHLYLPATEDEIEQRLTQLDDYAEDPSKPVEIRDVDCEIVGVRQYLRMADLSREGELKKLNTLAGMIEDMDERQRNTLWGALDSESISGLDDVLRVAKHLDQYVFLPNITSDIELGRILVDTGYKVFHESVQPYLDYRAIGAEYYADHGGAYTSYGYVKRRESSQVQSIERSDALITIHLRTLEATGTVGRTYCLSLPADEDELDMAKDKLGVDYFTEATIDKIEFGEPYLEELIPQDCFCVEDANELALGIEEMMQRDGELLKYLAVLSVMEPETLADALRLAIDLDDYERVPEDTEEYGKQVFRRLGADDEIIGAIENYMDFERLGEDSMVEDGVRQTEFGLIRCISEPFDEPEYGQKMV